MSVMTLRRLTRVLTKHGAWTKVVAVEVVMETAISPLED